MKDDAPAPAEIPRKRRAVELALDRWLAEWLARDDLAPSDRRRLEAERERRKRLAKVQIVSLGFLVDAGAGRTPQQRKTLMRWLDELEFRADVRIVTGELNAVVRESDLCFAAPRHGRAPDRDEPGVWAAIRYARHRGVPVRIVKPNGEEM